MSFFVHAQTGEILIKNIQLGAVNRPVAEYLSYVQSFTLYPRLFFLVVCSNGAQTRMVWFQRNGTGDGDP
jgi:hypothetical protein